MKKTVIILCLLTLVLSIGAVADAAASVEKFAWMGQKEDKVGATKAQPDTILDGKCRLELFLPAKAVITSIMVSTVNAEGTQIGSNVWHSKNSSYPMVGVYYKRATDLINESHVDNLGVYSGKSLFYLYLSDVNQDGFAIGKHFKVDVLLGNGEVITKTVRQGFR